MTVFLGTRDTDALIVRLKNEPDTLAHEAAAEIERLTAERDREKTKAQARRKALEAAESKLAEARKALEEIQKANDDFVAGMPADWEGDPLHDAISAALAVFAQQGKA